MQLQDLEIYQKLYDLRSINQTATQLGFAQSNISARLKVLEAEFGVTLFERSPQGIVPTKAGEEFAAYADQVLTATQTLRTHLSTTAVKPKVLISTLLFDYLVVHQHDYSLKQTDFQLASSTEIESLTHCEATKVITYAKFFARGYRHRGGGHLQARFLQAPGVDPMAVPMLVNADQKCPFRQRSLHFVQQDRTRVQEIDAWSSIIQLVASGQGVALLPSYLAQVQGLQVAWPSHRFQIPYSVWTKE